MTHHLRNITLFLLISLTLFSPSTWAEEEVATTKTPIYYAFSEPFTINFLHQSQQQIRYLQIKVSVMSFDQETITNTELNEPMLQDALRMLFSQQTMEAVSSIEGRVALQKMALELVKTILKEEAGKEDVESVYFTSFIMQ